MSKQIIQDYQFNVSAQTITFTDYTTVYQQRIQLIVDTSINQILYNFADASVASIGVSGNVVTLSTLPVSATNSDTLQIIYNPVAGDTTAPFYDTEFVSDGFDETQGSVNDVAVVGDNIGTVSAKLRGVSKIWNSIWNSGNNWINVNLASALNQVFDSVLTYPRGVNYQHITGNVQITGTPGTKLVSIFVASCSGTPTITVYDNTSTGGTVMYNTFTPIAGTTYDFKNTRCITGIYVTIGGIVDCTVGFDPTTT